ncbi:MAG TPA: family 78 glycoside hydrolase catalytic domain [Opitutaceae bacterium]|nr:family 78 glycoside hydrolase catalytic domain [Opitutaceae bacterium]
MPGTAQLLPAMFVDGTSPRWTADYVWCGSWGPGLTTRYFRNTFLFSRTDSRVLVYVTADSRYRLWLNGERLGFGPARGTLLSYHFECYDVTGWLLNGKNVLAAEVRWYGIHAPTSEVHSPKPGLLVQAEGIEGLDTPGNWRAWEDLAVSPDTSAYIENAQEFLNHMERIDLRHVPLGWQSVGFDDSRWQTVFVTGRAVSRSTRWGVQSLRTLVPRDVAPLSETAAEFYPVADRSQPRARQTEESWSWAEGEGGEILFDAGSYVTGFVVLEVSGGRGRRVEVVYAEALGRWAEVSGVPRWVKEGRRDNLEDGAPHGYCDTVFLSGESITWEPFHWRAFRWVKVKISPGDTRVTLGRISYRLCVHPQKFTAYFSSSDLEAERIVEVSKRTFQMGAHEIYDDSPYFEQLTYIADARLEALGSFYLCNEVSLPRRTIRLFMESVRSNGLIDARVPCHYARQTIPFFCLHWIFMVADYWTWVGKSDHDFVRRSLLVVDTILCYFRRHLRADGMIGVTDGWNVVDDAPEWPEGVPPAVKSGGSTYLSCLFVEALDVAAFLHKNAGEPGDGLRWQRLARQLARRIRVLAWDEPAGLFVEGPEHRSDRFSQHTQAAAINSGVATSAQRRRVARRLMIDTSLIPAHSMQAYYVGQALARCGLFAQWHRLLLQPWRRALSHGLTTWPEYPDPCRSDCHAWAAWPAFSYIHTVLGVGPDSPGWEAIRVAPVIDGLEWARGEAPTPWGKVSVSWRKENGSLQLEIEAPSDAPVIVRFLGRIVARTKGGSLQIFVIPLGPVFRR